MMTAGDLDLGPAIEAAEHDWEPDIVLGKGPVLVCARCGKRWWPDKNRPKTACRNAPRQSG